MYLKLMICSAVHNARCVAAPSEFVRERILNYFPGAAEKTRVIPHGVDPMFSCYDDLKAQKLGEYYCLPSRFILCVATIEPRKNLLKLLDAFSIYSSRAPEPLDLVIAGDRGYQSEKVFRRAERADIATQVRFLGYVPDSDLALLYGMADCFVYPSLYEGFGMPVLEAMTAGCPVITSNTASLPEAAGNAALLIDPSDSLEISGALAEVTENAALRSSMSADGKKHVETMTWSVSAEKYKELFHYSVQKKVN
jgi:glycosyltransferase involved in cell wall biosynthesis